MTPLARLSVRYTISNTYQKWEKTEGGLRRLYVSRKMGAGPLLYGCEEYHTLISSVISVACLVPEGIFEGVTPLDLPVSSAGGRSWGRTLILAQALGCWKRARVC